jgi:hypothetical protein
MGNVYMVFLIKLHRGFMISKINTQTYLHNICIQLCGEFQGSKSNVRCQDFVQLLTIFGNICIEENQQFNGFFQSLV